jgi:hypothetical protein
MAMRFVTQQHRARRGSEATGQLWSVGRTNGKGWICRNGGKRRRNEGKALMKTDRYSRKENMTGENENRKKDRKQNRMKVNKRGI